MAIVKLALLVIVTGAQWYVTTPPNVRPPTDQLREQHGSECIVPYFTAIAKSLISSWLFLEGSVLFALSDYCPPSLARPILRHLLPPTVPTQLTTLTPAFVAGACLSLTSALLRAHCFHALGPCFTFELAIRPSHTLVTHGVYSVVRHPSYTGVFGVTLGWLLCVLDRSGWAVRVLAGHVGEEVTRAVVSGVWAVTLGVMYVGVKQRMDKEDAMLEDTFGEAWRAWAKRVPYRLILGVY